MKAGTEHITICASCLHAWPQYVPACDAACRRQPYGGLVESGGETHSVRFATNWFVSADCTNACYDPFACPPDLPLLHTT